MEKQWINFTKLIAILAVVIDHTNGTLYTNPKVALSTYFSVTVFVFLSGITSYYSNEKHKHELGLKESLRRIKSIAVPYAVATAIYLVAAQGYFDLRVYISHLLNFSVSGPFYFVLFYLQLVTVSPFLFKILNGCNSKKYAYIYHLMVFMLISAVSVLAIKYTFVLPVHGGGQYVLGGSYLLVYYLGMLFGSSNFTFKTDISKKFLLCISGVLLSVWFCFISGNNFKLDSFFQFGNGINPPSVSLIVYGLLMSMFLFCFVSCFEKTKVLGKAINVISRLGKYSLFIFLYHLLVMNLLLKYGSNLQNIWIKGLIFLTSMVMIPILFKKALDMLQKYIRTFLDNSKA